MEAILYIAHGTRSKKGADEARTFINNVKSRVVIPIQEMSFLELTEPFVEEGFKRCVEKGATNITVIPLFLLAAGHIKQDIPLILTQLQEQYPDIHIYLEDSFGVQESILDAAVELVKINVGDIRPNDRLLIVGRGSSDPSIQGDFSVIAKGLKSKLGICYVSVCYLAAIGPRLNEGLDNILENWKGRVIVLPYLLFSGLLSAEIDRELRKRREDGKILINTGPLTRHHVFADIITKRANRDRQNLFTLSI